MLKNERKELEKYQTDLSFIDVQPSSDSSNAKSKRLAKVEEETRQQWFSSIKKDFFLGEAVNIMKDILERHGEPSEK